jgi:hypothetical protein
MDLMLCAINPSSGQVRFGPKLSYTLPVAELAYLVHASRVELREDHLVVLDPRPTGEPLADFALTVLQLPAISHSTVHQWVRLRGPQRISLYLDAVVDAGIVKVVTAGQSGGKTLTVVDPDPINQVTRRLIAVLDGPAPGFEDRTFAVLADAAGIARPHLKAWDSRRRARLRELRHSTGDGDAAQVMRAGLEAIRESSELAMVDPRSLNERIGLTQLNRITSRGIPLMDRKGPRPTP